MKTKRPLLDIIGPALYSFIAIFIIILSFGGLGPKSFMTKYLWYATWGVYALLFVVSIFTKILYPPLLVRNNILYIALDRNIIPKKIPLADIDHIEHHTIDLSNPYYHVEKIFSESLNIFRKSGKKYRINFGRINEKRYHEIGQFVKFALNDIQIKDIISKKYT